jgi:hypothetical protein
MRTLIPLSYDAFNQWISACPLSGHPLDQQRWFRFLLVLSINRELLTADQLEQSLINEFGWSVQDAENTALKFEEQSLLVSYVRENI